MAKSKMTQRRMFAEVVKALNGEDTAVETDVLVEFVKGRIEVLDRKSANRKPTKSQEENAKFVEIIKGIVSTEGQTIAEIKAQNEELADFSPQKMSALLRMAGAKSEKVGKVTYFSVVE